MYRERVSMHQRGGRDRGRVFNMKEPEEKGKQLSMVTIG